MALETLILGCIDRLAAAGYDDPSVTFYRQAAGKDRETTITVRVGLDGKRFAMNSIIPVYIAAQYIGGSLVEEHLRQIEEDLLGKLASGQPIVAG
jgi:hypothetical protein